MEIAEGTVKKTHLEDQRLGIIQETEKIKKEVTIDTENWTTSTIDTETCTSTTPKSFKLDFLRNISLLGHKFWCVLSYILNLILFGFYCYSHSYRGPFPCLHHHDQCVQS